MEYAIVFVAVVCGVGKYINVAALRGEPAGQLMRLSPIIGYVLLSIAVLYAPGLVLWMLLFLLLLIAADYAFSFGDIYNAAKKAIPPTTVELLKRLKLAPYVLIALLLIYLGTSYHHHATRPAKKKTTSTAVADSLTSTPSEGEVSDQAKWDELGRQNP